MTFSFIRPFMWCVCLFVLASPAWATEALRVSESSLENGLKIVVVEEHRAPVATHMLWFRVGAADEAKGVSGVAHYLEHMFFKGTSTIPEEMYLKTIEKRGGQHNAFTGQDFTAYYITAASEHLEDIMRIESDRMKNLSPPENSYLKELDVILEERSARIDNHPQAVLSEKMTKLLFNQHPYHIPIIGWRDEMEKLSKDDVMGFYRQNYHPANGVLVVVGDVTMDEVRSLAEEYYGDWEAKTPIKRPWIQSEPEWQSGTIEHHDPNVKQANWIRYYPTPGLVQGDTSQAFPLMLLADVLGEGKASVLYQELVLERKLAVAASASYSPFQLGPSVFAVTLVPATGVELDALEEAYDEVMAQFVENPIDAKTLERVANRMKAATIFSRDGIQGLAFIFGQLTMLGKDNQFFEAWPTMIGEVTPEAIQAAAASLLGDKPHVTGKLLPQKEVSNATP